MVNLYFASWDDTEKITLIGALTKKDCDNLILLNHRQLETDR